MYHKIPKYSDIQNFVENTIRLEVCNNASNTCRRIANNKDPDQNAPRGALIRPRPYHTYDVHLDHVYTFHFYFLAMYMAYAGNEGANQPARCAV